MGEEGSEHFFLLVSSSFSLGFGGSSSFLINEVISNPLNGFCSVVLVGDINLLSDSWTGLLAGLLMSETIRQNE